MKKNLLHAKIMRIILMCLILVIAVISTGCTTANNQWALVIGNAIQPALSTWIDNQVNSNDLKDINKRNKKILVATTVHIGFELLNKYEVGMKNDALVSLIKNEIIAGREWCIAVYDIDPAKIILKDVIVATDGNKEFVNLIVPMIISFLEQNNIQIDQNIVDLIIL